MSKSTGAHFLTLTFGGESTECLSGPEGIAIELPVPALSSETVEEIVCLEGRVESSRVGNFHLLRNEDLMVGAAIHELNDDLEQVSYAHYRQVLSLFGATHHPYRLWHYVPAINEVVAGLENYQHFNIGRRRAFDDCLGPGAEREMPAASAVGTPGKHFVMIFVAGRHQPRHIENPEQMPSYRYPATYGPKPPSFARATVVRFPERELIFVSGTASIKGHQTIAVGDVGQQLATTIDNLKLVIQESGLPCLSEISHLPQFRMKVYLRHSEHLPLIAPALQRELGATDSNVVILQSEICRKDLDIEIEFRFST